MNKLRKVIVFILRYCSVTVIDVICSIGDVRLVGGSNPMEGRLEVCFYNQWGSLCSESWSANEANVACRQLGYAGAGKWR